MMVMMMVYNYMLVARRGASEARDPDTLPRQFPGGPVNVLFRGLRLAKQSRLYNATPPQEPRAPAAHGTYRLASPTTATDPSESIL